MPGIGRDLLDLPFAEMVRNLAIAIADGQTALDRNSLETLKALSEIEVDVLTDITETISPEEQRIDVEVPDGQGGTRTEQVVVTGARITSQPADPVTMNMLEAGLAPTFYQFTEAAIEVKLSITMREDRTAEQRGQSADRGAAAFGFLGLGASRAYASSVDYRSQNAYSYQAQGASTLTATMRPVPPPARLQPTVTTVNTFTQPPTVTRNPQ